MREIIAEHLVVGGGLLGLSVADHLLRRGAESVAILEATHEAPPHKVMGDPGLVLRTGSPEYRPLEDRALLLLEEWQDYLGVDPGHARTGSLLFPRGDEETHGPASAETLESYPGWESVEEQDVAFSVDDGLLDPVELISALHWQVRRRGGQLFFDCELGQLAEEGAEFSFVAGSRGGKARRLYFTDVSAGWQPLREMGLPSVAHPVTWHCFEFDAPPGERSIVRFRREGEVDAGILEDPAGGDAAPLRDDAIVVDHGDGQMDLVCRGDTPSTPRDAPVDWNVLERFRAEWGARVPTVAEGAVRRGHARNRLDLRDDAPGILRFADGRILAAGGFGIHEVLLGLSVGERLAEEGLGLDPTVP